VGEFGYCYFYISIVGLFGQPDAGLRPARRSGIRHISLLRSSGNYPIADYKHSAPPALGEGDSKIPAAPPMLGNSPPGSAIRDHQLLVRYLWTIQWKRGIFFDMSKGKNTSSDKSEVLQGTLDLMVLKVLDALGPQHGYGIARRIEQVSEQVLQLNEGTVYTSLLRLQQRGWISADWGASENNRKAKYYSITKSGRKQLARETESWERMAGVIGRLLKLGSQG
jgi:PadR family transcriptional regulator